MTQPISGQEFVRATVHLAGEVDIETGHSSRYSVEHVQTRLGSALIYLLDFDATADLVRVARVGAERARGLFDDDQIACLPVGVLHDGQESSVVMRMRGRQTTVTAQAITAAANRYRRPYLTCQVGGLVLVLHDAEAVARLVEVTETSYRVASALWPVEASMAAQAEADELAERRVRERAGR